MKLIINFLILVCIGCNSSIKPQNTIKKIDIASGLDSYTAFNLSDIIKNIRYVPLEFTPECPIQRIDKIEYANNCIYISDLSKLMIFDKNGKFIRIVGNKGKGPGEYLLIRGFTITPSQRIYVLPNWKNTIIEYSIKGEFIKEWKIECDIQSQVQRIDYLNDSTLIMDCMPFNRIDTSYFKMALFYLNNRKVQKFKSLLSFPSKVDPKYGLFGQLNHYWHYKNEVYYLEEFSDTIFNIKKDKFSPEYYFDMGKFKQDRKNYADKRIFDSPNTLYVSDIADTELFIYFQCWFECKYQLTRYNKKTGEFQTSNPLKRKNDDPFDQGRPGFINDYDGGPSFWPQYKPSEKMWIQHYDAFEIKEIYQSNKNTNSKCFAPNKRDELNTIIKQMKEEDNPLLMIIELK